MFFDHITAVDDRALEEIFDIVGFSLKKRWVCKKDEERKQRPG
jgi:hypothetical protein